MPFSQDLGFRSRPRIPGESWDLFAYLANGQPELIGTYGCGIGAVLLRAPWWSQIPGQPGQGHPTRERARQALTDAYAARCAETG